MAKKLIYIALFSGLTFAFSQGAMAQNTKTGKTTGKSTTTTTTTTTTTGAAGTAAAKGTLYDRLGGKTGIQAVVDDFVNNVAADTRINNFFAGTASDPKRLKAFKDKLSDQICEAAGGPCKYKGKDMKTAHKGMPIKDEHFSALVEDLTKSLNKFKVPEAGKQALLGALGPMKPDIVTQ